MSGEAKTLTIRIVGNARGGVKAIHETESATQSLGKRMSKISGKFKSVGSSLTSVGTRMTAVSAAALYFVARAGASYVDSLNKIKVLSGANAATMKRVAQQLEGNSGKYAKMGQTVGDAASGVVELTKAGLSLGKSMKAVGATMVLAKAGELSVADASNLVSKTLHTFNLKASQAGRIANYLANAANISSADVSDLAESLKFVAPVAAASGVKLKTVSALLAELSNKGIEASNAGTGLRKFFLSLSAPAGIGGKAIKSLGVQVFDAAGKMRPFKDVLADLGKAIGKVSDKTRKKDLRAIFGLTGINAATVMLNGGVKGLNKYEKGVSKAGAAARLANSASKGLAGTFKALKATVTSIAQSVYRQFSPALDGILKKVVKWVAGFSKMSKGGKKLVLIIAAIALAAGPVILTLGLMATAIGALLTPVGAVMGIIALLGVGLGVAYAKSESFRNGVQKLASGFMPLVKTIGGFLKSLLPGIKEFGSKLMSAVGPGLAEIGGLIKTELIPAFQKIAPILKPVLKFLLMMFGSALIGAIKGVIQVIKGVVQVISGVISLVADLIHGDWSAVWHDLVNIVKGILNILIGAFKVWWNGSVLAIFRHGFVAVLGLFKGGWKGILALGKGYIKLLENILKGVIKILTWPFRKGMAETLKYAKIGFKFIRGEFSGGVGGIRKILGRVLEVVTYPFRTALSTGKRIVSSGIDRVIGFFKSVPGRIRSALGRVRSAVLGAVRGAGTWLWNAGKNIIEGLLRGIGSMIGQVQDKLHKLTNLIPDWKGPASRDATLLQPAGESIMDGFMKGLGSKFSNVRRMLGGFTNSLSNPAMPALAGAGGAAGSLYGGSLLSRSSGPQGVTVVVQVDGNVIGEKDFAQRITPVIRDGLTKIGKRNGGKIFG